MPKQGRGVGGKRKGRYDTDESVTDYSRKPTKAKKKLKKPKPKSKPKR